MRKQQPYPKDYSTHVPIIVGVSRLIRPKTIIESGSGMFSTPLWLDRRAFPDVEKVLSSEMSRDWQRKVETETNLKELSEGRFEWAAGYGPYPSDEWDLAFADSGTVETKVAFLHACKATRSKFTILHDSEVSEYGFFRTEFLYFDFQAYEPCTALLWQPGYLADVVKLTKMDQILEAHCDEDPTDITRWLEIFNTELV